MGDSMKEFLKRRPQKTLVFMRMPVELFRSGHESKILVTGCGRSGNTLMLMLLAEGFNDVHMTEGEIDPLVFPGIKTDATWTAYKKPTRVRWVGYYLRIGVRVIFMLRDPRAVLISRHFSKPDVYKIKPWKWFRAIRSLERNKNHPNLILVRFEDLICDPNGTQERIARKFGFEIKRPFSECHRYFRKDAGHEGAMGGVRPIDRSRIRSWERCSDEDREYLRYCFKDGPKSEKLNRYLREYYNETYFG